jgi:O-antigen/teichoic acid export membrane protein
MWTASALRQFQQALWERRHTAALSASVLAQQASRMGVSLLAARMIAPQDYGWWVLGSTVIGYLAFAQLGTSSALAKVVPEFVARGEPASVRRLTGIALQHNTLAGVAGLLLLWGLGASGLVGWGGAFGLAIGAMFLTQQLAATRLAALTAQQDRMGVTARYAAISVGMAGFGLAGAWYFGRTGLAGGFAIAWSLALLGRVSGSPTGDSTPIAAKDAWTLLVRSGIPITAAGTLFLMLMSVDRFIVAKLFSIEAAGVYGLASVAASSMIAFQQALSTLFLPRLSHARAAGASNADLRATAVRLSSIVFKLTVLCYVGFALAFPLLVYIALPEYRESAVPALLLAAGLSTFAVTAGESNLLLARGANVLYGLTLLKGAALVAVACAVGALVMHTLTAVAASTALGFVGSAWLLRHAVRKSHEESPRGDGEISLSAP